MSQKSASVLSPLRWLCVFLLLTACGQDKGTTFDSHAGLDAANQAAAAGGQGFWTDAKLHDEILTLNPDYMRNAVFRISGGRPVGISLANTSVTDLGFVSGMPLEALELTDTDVSDISPLVGLPLQELWAERTNVKDLAPLRGMPLRKLHLNMTKVHDLSSLEGAPLEELNLAETPVDDLTPLSGAPIQTLWLNGTGVSDLSPLKGMPLIDLNLSGTKVTDISPLAQTRLLRLNLGELEVEDLTPLLEMRLSRLVFDPRHMRKGMDGLRNMESLREIGTTLSDFENDLDTPEVFWAQLDGRFKRPESATDGEFELEPDPEGADTATGNPPALQ